MTFLFLRLCQALQCLIYSRSSAAEPILVRFTSQKPLQFHKYQPKSWILQVITGVIQLYPVFSMSLLTSFYQFYQCSLIVHFFLNYYPDACKQQQLFCTSAQLDIRLLKSAFVFEVIQKDALCNLGLFSRQFKVLPPFVRSIHTTINGNQGFQSGCGSTQITKASFVRPHLPQWWLQGCTDSQILLPYSKGSWQSHNSSQSSSPVTYQNVLQAMLLS